MYWSSTNESLPIAVYNQSKMALILYDYETTFGENGLVDGIDDSGNLVDQNDHCPALCICDFDGHCYRPYRYNAEVMFVPYCDGMFDIKTNA